jgi:hypothetical protein
MAASPAIVRPWRVFPWDNAVVDGSPFSASFVPSKHVSGRFDLGDNPPVLYLGESPTHTIGEKIQRYRGQTLEAADLREFHKPLALVEVTITLPDSGLVADLCDPAELMRRGCRPDELMSRDLARTQSISRRLYDAGLVGFRVWSPLSGDWHSTVLYLDRARDIGSITFGSPAELTLRSPAVLEAAQILAISIKA